MMVALLLYAYARGTRSSRQIERACEASVGVIAVDGTKPPGNASRNANVDYEQLAREILEEAKAVDAAEDELYGDARGDELPEQLRTGEGRRAWLREAKRQLEEQRAREARPVARGSGARGCRASHRGGWHATNRRLGRDRNCGHGGDQPRVLGGRLQRGSGPRP